MIYLLPDSRLLPRRSQSSLSILPMRGPSERNQLHGDVGFGGLQRNRLKLFVERICRGCERIGLIHPGFFHSLLGVRKSEAEPLSMKSWEDQTVGIDL